MTEPAKYEGPIYDLMCAYSTLTYGNRYPRVMAGEKAKRWVHEYILAHSTHPHREDWYDRSPIESGDVPEDVFKFYIDEDQIAGFMDAWRERHEGMFGDHIGRPNLGPILVRIPVDSAI